MPLSCAAMAIASTMPGKPPPLPKSTQIRAAGASAISCSESATWRVQSVGRVKEFSQRLVDLKQLLDCPFSLVVAALSNLDVGQHQLRAEEVSRRPARVVIGAPVFEVWI